MTDAARGPRTGAASRVRRPTWREPRFLAGIGLVVLSAVLGAFLVAAARGTSPVLVATRPLVAGQPVGADDVATVEAALGQAAGRYLEGAHRLPADAVALRDVAPGELVPAGAVGPPGSPAVDPVVVPVAPEAARVLSVGSRVDVWVNRRVRAANGAAEYGTPTRLLAAAAVARVPEEPSGVAAGSGTSAGVQLMVPRARVAALLAAVDQEARITLVPVTAAAPA